jgi:ferredoxin
MKHPEKAAVDAGITGFVFPVYFARPPAVIERFIEDTLFRSGGYVFAAVNGAGLFGNTLSICDRLFRKKGIELNAGFRFRMPGNHPRMALFRKSNHRELYDQAAAKTGEIAAVISGLRTHKKEIYRGRAGAVLAFLLGYEIPFEYSEKGSLDDYFWLNENCVNCGLCVQVCPVGNIVQTKRRPVWQNRCINCFACYNHCRWNAIQVRCPWKIFQLNNDYIQLPRYSHPEFFREKSQAKGEVISIRRTGAG